jgi:hypothetical protein
MVFSKRVLVLACVAGVFLPQQAQARSAVIDALRRAERSLCKVVDAKGCNRKKPEQRRAKPSTRKKVKTQEPEAPPPAIVKPEIIKPEAVKPVIVKPGTTRVIVPAPPVVTIENPKPPLPRPKPLDLEEIPPEPTIEIPPEPTIEAPAAKPKPDVIASAITPKFIPPPIVAPQSTPDAAACYAALSKLNVTFTQNASYAQNGSCNVVNAVQLKSYTVNGVEIEFPDGPILNCAFASQFMNFIRDHAQPIFTTKTNSKIAKLYTGPGFVCRGRNGDISAKLSEHASGNAVDIERIQLADGRVVLVKDAISTATTDYDVMTTIRHAACTYFTTVLGPGANAAHASHFHFDLGQHGKSGTYRICE